MSTTDLQKKLIDKINHTKDERLLEEVFRFMELESEEIEVYNLSNEQIEAINEAKQQIKNGEFLTNDEANREIKEWLKQ